MRRYLQRIFHADVPTVAIWKDSQVDEVKVCRRGPMRILLVMLKQSPGRGGALDRVVQYVPGRCDEAALPRASPKVLRWFRLPVIGAAGKEGCTARRASHRH